MKWAFHWFIMAATHGDAHLFNSYGCNQRAGCESQNRQRGEYSLHYYQQNLLRIAFKKKKKRKEKSLSNNGLGKDGAFFLVVTMVTVSFKQRYGSCSP